MVGLAVWFSVSGGFRRTAYLLVWMLLCHFYLEGLYGSNGLPFVFLTGVLVLAIGLPMVSRLPLTVQRAFSFLPIDVDPAVRMSAEYSTEWRLRMWRAVVPTIPQYLVLGKGYSINPSELAMAQGVMSAGDSTEAPILA